jgi:hypothetical protein
MSRVKITKKDLKEDELRHFGHEVYDYVKKHQTKIMIIVAVVVIAFVGNKIYKVQHATTLRKANNIFSIATKSFQMGIMAETVEARNEKMNSCIGSCKRLQTEFGSTPLASHALYYQASAAFFKSSKSEDLDEPISLFNKYIQKAAGNNEKAVGYVGLGYSYENKYFLSDDKQFLDQAIKAYEGAISNGKGKAAGSEAQLCKGRLLELQFKDDQAAILYEKVKKERKIKDLMKDLAPVIQYSDPQARYLSMQINNIKQLFSYSKTAQFSLERVEGQK